MENIIVCLILLIIIVCITGYLMRAKKRGQKCIGCPYGSQCNGGCNSKN